MRGVQVASEEDTGPCLTLSVMFNDVEAASKTHCFEQADMSERDRLRTTLPHTPYILHPTPHPTPYTAHPTPYTLYPTPRTLHPAPYTLHPVPCTLNPKP